MSTTPSNAPMTAVIRRHPAKRQDWISSVETWSEKGIDLDDQTDMEALVQRLDAQAQNPSDQVGLLGVAFRVVGEHNGQWQQVLMTQPYYDVAQVIQGQSRGPIEATGLNELTQQLYAYVDERFGDHLSQYSQVRFEVMEVNSVRRPAQEQASEFCQNSVADTLMTLGQQACFLEPGHKNPAVQGLIGFKGSMTVLPGGGADPEYGVIENLTVEQSGQHISAYILGAGGESIVIPAELQPTPLATSSYQNEAIRQAASPHKTSQINPAHFEDLTVNQDLLKIKQRLSAGRP